MSNARIGKTTTPESRLEQISKALKDLQLDKKSDRTSQIRPFPI